MQCTMIQRLCCLSTDNCGGFAFNPCLFSFDTYHEPKFQCHEYRVGLALVFDTCRLINPESVKKAPGQKENLHRKAN